MSSEWLQEVPQCSYKLALVWQPPRRCPGLAGPSLAGKGGWTSLMKSTSFYICNRQELLKRVLMHIHGATRGRLSLQVNRSRIWHFWDHCGTLVPIRTKSQFQDSFNIQHFWQLAEKLIQTEPNTREMPFNPGEGLQNINQSS